MEKRKMIQICICCSCFLSVIYGIARSDKVHRRYKNDEITTMAEKKSKQEIFTPQRIMYITFEDGPGLYTQDILYILDRYDIKATFFVTGMDQEYTHLLKDIQQNGHAVGLHSFSHDEQEIYRDVDAYFNDLGLFDNHVTAAHCVWLTPEDRQILADKKVFVSHCPISNLKLGSGLADMTALLEKGINISIGTDGVASNDNLNFLEDMKLTALLQKGIHHNPALFSAETVLKMASYNGALSQNRLQTGALKLGNQADIIAIDYHSINLLPCIDVISSLVYATLPSDIKMTMVNGKILYENGQFHTIDIEKVMHEVSRIGRKLY